MKVSPTRRNPCLSPRLPRARLWALAAVLRALAVGAAEPAGLPDFGSHDFTVAAWVRTERGGTILCRAPAEGPWAPQGKAFFVRGGRLCFDVGWVGVVTSTAGVADGRWHHVAVTGPGDVRLYVDGRLDQAGALAMGPDVGGHVVKLGVTSVDFPSPSGFSGDLDDVRVYDRALSVAEVGGLVQAAPAEVTGLVAHWPLDGTLDDATGRANHAQPAGPGPGTGGEFVEGRLGRAWRLDGTAAARVPPGLREQLGPLLAGADPAAVRCGVERLATRFGPAYPGAAGFKARLAALAERLAGVGRDGAPAPETVVALVEALRRLQREALVEGNPLMDFDGMLFIRRHTFQSSHYYTDYIDGCERFGGGLCVLSWRDGAVRDLVPSLSGGIIGRYDLRADGRRVVFDYKAAADKGFRIWEVNVDGSGLHALTVDPPDEAARVERYRLRGLSTWAGRPATYGHGTDDMHPCYLPDGGIAFVSTRCEYGILCDGPDQYTTSVLYRMDGGGGHLQRLTNSAVSESAPSVMNDGRLLYTRWEYVDKGAVAVKCLWCMRPDGTGSTEVFGNDIDFPDTCNQGRAIPGFPNLFVYIGAPHMPLGVGTVIRIDINRPVRTRQPMVYVTPDVDVRQEWGWNHARGGRWVADAAGPLYQDAFPLSERVFLVSCNPDRPWNDGTAYGLYLLDDAGNRVRLHQDPGWSCWQPMPLRPRPGPPSVIASALPPAGSVAATGTLVLADVYRGLPGVARGTVRHLRVLEQVPRPWSARRRWEGDEFDQQHACVSRNAALGLKVLHGVVPVQADGSACFTVPADRNLYLQALDADYMEVQRMRTYVNLRPGEVRSCVGCHAPRGLAPASGGAVRAPLDAPPPPGPQPGEVAPRPIHYATDVQPILDSHCVRCHSGPQPKAGMDLTGAETALFCRSYESLLDRGLVQTIGENHPKTGNVALVPPLTLGSHASRLVAHLRKGHQSIALRREEWVRLVTWVDANAQYYGSYFGRRNSRYRGSPDYRPVPTLESALGTPPAAPGAGGGP